MDSPGLGPANRRWHPQLTLLMPQPVPPPQGTGCPWSTRPPFPPQSRPTSSHPAATPGGGGAVCFAVTPLTRRLLPAFLFGTTGEAAGKTGVGGQRLGRRSHKPRSSWSPWKLDETREDPPLEPSGGPCSADTDFRPLASLTLRELIPDVLSHSVYGSLWQRPWEPLTAP